MNGADELLDSVTLPREHAQSTSEHTDVDDISLPPTTIATPLQHLTTRRRRCSALIPFLLLTIKCKKDMYQRAAVSIESNESLTPIDATCQVASTFGVSISSSDRHVIGQCARAQAKAKNQLYECALVVSTSKALLKDHNLPHVNNRKGRKQNLTSADYSLPSRRKQSPYHGALSYLEYQQICKDVAIVASLHVSDDGWSAHKAVAYMSASRMIDNGVSLSDRACNKFIVSAIANNYIGISPQKPGGQALPSSIENSIANTVTRLRENNFLVFPKEVIELAAIEIKGTAYESYSPPPLDGRPTRGWYQGWLRRMHFLTGALRPLE
jgi:hypothetical protein